MKADRSNRMVRWGLLVVLPSVLWMSGCSLDPAPKQVRSGLSLADYGPYSLKLKDRAPDFVFVDDQGNLRRMSELPGHVTLVVFPESSGWPKCDVCQKVAQLTAKLDSPTARVLAVSVVKPDKPADNALAAMDSCRIGTDRLLTIVDSQGQIRYLYGPKVDGMFYVMNDQHRVFAMGRLSDWDAIDRGLRGAVRSAESHTGPNIP
ncbi:MAG: hypothetical protein IT443_02685 [Phycisphaeraceae bacterium]|nr:hypothetical protein [Phycisphaeraceae bacterium]